MVATTVSALANLCNSEETLLSLRYLVPSQLARTSYSQQPANALEILCHCAQQAAAAAQTLSKSTPEAAAGETPKSSSNSGSSRKQQSTFFAAAAAGVTATSDDPAYVREAAINTLLVVLDSAAVVLHEASAHKEMLRPVAEAGFMGVAAQVRVVCGVCCAIFFHKSCRLTCVLVEQPRAGI